MAMRNPIQMFGICRAVLYNAVTGELYGPPIRVLESSSFTSDKELIENVGGCQAYPWSIAQGRSSAEGSLSFKEISPWMYAAMAGGSVEINAAEAGGNVSSLTNIKGSSITSLTAGLDVAALAGQESKLAFGHYRIKALTASTIAVYSSTSNAANSLEIATGTISDCNTALAAFGLEITENGTTDLTVGDVASFEVRPVNAGSAVVVVGKQSDVTPEVGILLYVPQQDGNMMEVDIFRARFAGLPLNLTSNEFQSVEASFRGFYDSVRDGVYKTRIVSLNSAI